MDTSPIITSKRGKRFCIFKISDLVKYDLNRVKDILNSSLDPLIEQGKCDKSEPETLLKNFTKNGYKQISFMVFGEAANRISDIRPGTIVCVINPRLMPK